MVCHQFPKKKYHLQHGRFVDRNASGDVTGRNFGVQSGGQSIKHSGLPRTNRPDKARVSGYRNQTGHRQGVVSWTTLVVQMSFFWFDSLKAMRHKVWTARSTSPLFDCKIYAQGLELLYSKMWERFANGLKPDHITDTTVKKWP